MTFFKFMAALNAIGMFGNLAAYAWGSGDPSSLAIGIACGVALLICQAEIRNG